MDSEKEKKINILGVNINKERKKDILKKISEFLNGNKQLQITTPNPEIILEAHEDEELFYILNSAELSIPDGFGLKCACLLMGKNIERFAGADMMQKIISIAEEKNKKIAIINWRGGLSKADDIKNSILKKWPKIKIIVIDVDRRWSLFNPDKLNLFNPDIIFSSLGYPWQEKFIYHNLPKIPSAKIGMGIGGSFDFLTGKRKRAPKFMRLTGLEWLWRLIIQPSRWRRIYKAVFVFLFEFIKWRFIKPFLYRPNVACLLYKKENNKFKILLVERKIEKDHWQLPQGGTDGEDIKTAGARELGEEIGTDKFKIIKTYKKLYKYDFDGSMSKFRVKSQEHAGYKGQKQGLVIAEFLGEDSDIKINFWEHEKWKWVDADNLMEEVHEYRKKATKIYYNKFNELKKI